MERYFFNFIFFAIVCLSFYLFACTPPGSPMQQIIAEVYSPEIIDDGKPEIPGTYIELANNPDINLRQKCLIEALLLNGNYNNEPYPFVQNLGITNLDPLLSVEGDGELASFYSTRLNNIDGLRGFKNLRRLTIRGSDLEDFQILEELPLLSKLDISYSKAKSLSSLRNCISLEELTIDEESGYFLEPIAHLIKEHSNSQGKKIQLKVITIKGMKKDYLVYPYYRSTGKITTHKGVYKLKYAYFKSNYSAILSILARISSVFPRKTA